MKRGKNITVTRHAVAVATAILLLAATAAADTISVDIAGLALYSKREVRLGHGSSVAGDIAGGGDISTGSNVDLKSIYSARGIELGDYATVRGTVLATEDATATQGLDFQGPSWTGKMVNLGDTAYVLGDIKSRVGEISLGTSAQVQGDVLSNDYIWIGSNSTIQGDASPGAGESVSTGSNVTITGSTDAYAKDNDSFSLPSWGSTPSAPHQGNQNVTGEADSVITLAPGSYKNVSIEQDSTLNLSAGTYVFKSFQMAMRGTINVDASDGDVVIHVLKAYETGHSVAFVVTGSGNALVNVYQGGVTLGPSNTMMATLRAWGSGFEAGDDTTFAGTIWAEKNIVFGSGAEVYLLEPTTLTFLAIGGTMALFRRRRQHLLLIKSA